MPIIKSILDTDLYKFTTSYAYSKLFPRAFGEFVFVDRSNDSYPDGFDVLLRKELDRMAELSLTEGEVNFIKNYMPYLPPTYIDFLKGFRFDPSEVVIGMESGKLKINATGLLYRVTLWETPILATVSELFFRMTGKHPDNDYMERVAIEKALSMKEQGITFSLFGMRRRFSF